MTDTYWREQAECVGEDPELFFPESLLSTQGMLQAEEAIAVCRRCPVISECLARVMRYEGNKGAKARDGIVGGLIPSQRRKLYEKTAAPHDNAQIEKAARETAHQLGTRIVRHVNNGKPWGQIATWLHKPTEVVRRAHALILSGQVIPAPERTGRPVLAA
ncbi:WhiB family transcriptional regulator [Kitasatospora sp. NPDC004289]